MDTPGRRSALALTLVIAASTATGCLVFVEFVLAHRPPGWDEAAHALQGALIAHDVRTGDLLGFLFDTYRQVYWPPLHSWLVGAAFLVTGPSMEAARAVSVLAFVVLAPTLFIVARTVEPRYGTMAGSLAAALTLTCPGMVALASANLLELPALLALSVTMLVYCRLDRDPGAAPACHALLGVSVVVTYLAKTNYGVLLVICIVLTKLFAAHFRLGPLLTRKNLYAALPLVLFCVIWFAWPAKIVTTWASLVNSPYGGDQGRGLAGLLFFPRAIVELTGPTSVLLWAGIVLAWKWRREPGFGFLLVVALTQFVIGELHHTKLVRHIVPMFPPMFVLTGVAGARLWEWLKVHRSADGTMAVALLTGLAILQISVFGFPGSNPVQTMRPEVIRQGTDVLEYVSTQARAHAPALVINSNRPWPHPPVVDWHLVSRGHLPVTASEETMHPARDRRHAVAFDRLRIPKTLQADARRVLDRYNAPSMTRTLRLISPEHPDRLATLLNARLRVDPPQSIIALVGASDTTTTVDLIEPTIVDQGYRRISMREFTRARGAEVRIYIYSRP